MASRLKSAGRTTPPKSKYYSVGGEAEFRKSSVSDIAAIWECQETGAKSLHSSVKLLPGDIISPMGAREFVDKPSYLSVQVDEDRHILLDPTFLQYINHSCDPNTFFDTTNMQVVCLKEIEVGEAMTFFYPSTEWSMVQPFDCFCGSYNCLHKIQGAKHLPPEVLAQYRLSSHIARRI